MARLARPILEFEKLQLVVTVIAAAAPLCHVLMSRVTCHDCQGPVMSHSHVTQIHTVTFVSHWPAVCSNSKTIVLALNFSPRSI